MRVLIVEDEAKLAEFLEKGLEDEAMAVDVARDGEEGSALARRDVYDVIVLDLMLPRKDGMEVLKEIRAAGLKTPILILSAKGDVGDRVKGLDLGADDYLPKPFAVAEFLARVRSLARRSSGAERSTTLGAGDLRLDLLSREVTRRGRRIVLTNKEFQLLEYMLHNKGRVLSRALITEHIWDIQFDGGTNVVDVMINRLRRKIDDDDTPLIHTVRGAGYVLKEPSGEPGS